jgi:Flp pilus assembly protein TadG
MMKIRLRTGKTFRTEPPEGAVGQTRKRTRLLEAVAETEGAQLLEFALSLPILLVFLVGIVQFAGAFTLKQKMANAAREGARIMVSNILAGSGCGGSNCSAQAAVGAIANYMTNEGVDSSCINPGSLASSGNQTWTATCGNGISLTINHQYVYTPSGGTPVTGTEVTVTYPYTWFFNDIIKLIVPGANLSFPNSLTETAVMQNIAN